MELREPWRFSQGSVVSDDGASLFGSFRFKHVQSIQKPTAHDFPQWKKHVEFFVVYNGVTAV